MLITRPSDVGAVSPIFTSELPCVLFLRLESVPPAETGAEEEPADEAPSPILPYHPHSPSTPKQTEGTPYPSNNNSDVKLLECNGVPNRSVMMTGCGTKEPPSNPFGPVLNLLSAFKL